MAVSAELRFEVEDLFRLYATALDSGDFDRWLELFAQESSYQLIPRDNYERGLPLALMRCETKAMLQDRVYAIRETMMYEPHYVRHLISGIHVAEEDDTGWRVEASYAVFETRLNELSRVLNVGRYIDRIVREDGALKFSEKRCVFDSLLVPTSIAIPI